MSETPRETRRSTRTNKAQLSTPGGDTSPTDTPNPRKRSLAAGVKTPTDGKQKGAKKPGKRGPGRPRNVITVEPDPVEDDPFEEEIAELLPAKIMDGEPLPTLKELQSFKGPADSYQSIAQSGVLAASIKRSRDSWVSGAHFTKYFTKTIPKKVKDRTAEDKEQMAKDKQLLKNMVRVGECQLTIDPHIFRVVLYMTREPPGSNANRQQQQWGTPSKLSGQPHHNAAPKNYPAYQAPLTGYNNPHPAYHPAAQSATPKYLQQPGPTPKPPMAPSKASHTGPRPAAAQPAAQAAPDPVIHELARRAGTDMKLKSVMKIVAAGKATPAQLEYFQGHINELTALIESRQKAAAANIAAAAAPSQTPAFVPAQNQPQSAAPASIQHQTQTSTQASPSLQPQTQTQSESQQQSQPQASVAPSTLQVQSQPAASQTMSEMPTQAPMPRLPVPASATALPAPVPTVNHTADSGTAGASSAPTSLGAPLTAPAAGGQNSSQTTPHHSPAPARPMQTHPQYSQIPTPLHSQYLSSAPMQPTQALFRTIYFEFVEGSGDRLVFPENSMLEYLPGGRQLRFSFLALKPLEQESKLDPKTEPKPGDLTIPVGPDQTSPIAPAPTAELSKKADSAPRFYQPVTAYLYSDNPHHLECLARAVRPPQEVQKYMEHVFDTMERAEERFLALRLPIESEIGRVGEVKEADKENASPMPEVLSAYKKRKLGKA